MDFIHLVIVESKFLPFNLYLSLYASNRLNLWEEKKYLNLMKNYFSQYFDRHENVVNVK